MINQVMDFLNTAILACSSWFVSVFKKTETVELYIVFLFIFLSVKFILSPIFGIGSVAGSIKSDTARNTKSSKKSSKNSYTNKYSSRRPG